MSWLLLPENFLHVLILFNTYLPLIALSILQVIFTNYLQVILKFY